MTMLCRLSTKRFGTYLFYVRNLTLIRRRLRPDLVTLIEAAKQVFGDDFAICLLETSKDYTTILTKLQSKRHQPVILHSDLIASKLTLQQVRNEVTKIRKNAVAERYKFLEQLISTSTNPKLIRRIIRAEELRQSYLKIKHIIKQPTTFKQCAYDLL